MEDRFCQFQQGVTIAHTTAPTVEFLKGFFDTRIISKNLWLSGSPDLSPCNFFLWSYVKIKVFAHNPTSIEELKVKIMKVIHPIDVQIRRKVFQNPLKRVGACWELGEGVFQTSLVTFRSIFT